MAVVYLAADTRLGNRHVAIKQINPDQLPTADQEWAVTAFQQEAAVLARLNHPTIARIIDFFQEDRFWYLVMEYVPGEALDKALSRYPRGLAEEQVLTWAAQLGGALDYLHQQHPPVVFRDLKPGNVMVQPDGTLKLIDFGIARYFKPGQTQDTLRLGTPGYAAPEQYGRGQTDARSDVYSFGVLLHQLLTGYSPALSPMNLPPILSLRPDISARVVQAVEQAIRSDPNQRYGSISAFATALGISISGYLVLPEPPVNEQSDSLFERAKAVPPLVLAVVGLLSLAVLFSLIWFVLPSGDDGSTAVAGDGSSADSMVVEVTQMVTATSDETSFLETVPTPTETAEPSATPTETAVPPTHTATPLPTFTPLPTLTATPVVAACNFNVANTFANTYRTHQTQLGCPTSNMWTTWSARESFERGFMFWRQDNGRIYVVYSNGRWASYTDTWSESEPDYSCGVQQSPPTPRRGFGKVWCNVSGVQQGLGNATDAESGENTTMQAFANGLIWQTSAGRFVLFNDGAWSR
jgi:serine/threonine protein kinase